VIGELLAAAGPLTVPALALATSDPPRSSGAFSSAAPASGDDQVQWPDSSAPTDSAAVRPPALRLRGPSAVTYVLAVLGSLAVGAAVAWRLLR
jgi:hypothetical protein